MFSCVSVFVSPSFYRGGNLVQRVRVAFPGHMVTVMELGPDTRAHQANE